MHVLLIIHETNFAVLQFVDAGEHCFAAINATARASSLASKILQEPACCNCVSSCEMQHLKQPLPDEQNYEADDSHNEAHFANGGSKHLQMLLERRAGRLCHDQRHCLAVLCVDSNCHYKDGA